MIKQRSKIYEFLSGQSCGGAHNVLGQCAGGLVCLVKVPEDVENFREAEINAVGKCVTESSPECPRSTDKEKKKNVNCRPCLLYTSPSPRDRQKSRMPSSA